MVKKMDIMEYRVLTHTGSVAEAYTWKWLNDHLRMEDEDKQEIIFDIIEEFRNLWGDD